MRNDIMIAGNALVDVVKMIEKYPEKNMLARISDCRRAIGGCVPNVAIDLARIDPSVRIGAMGCVGQDENGKFILDRLSVEGIDISQMKVSLQKPTSFTDVMTEKTSGERTFFFSMGASGEFGIDSIDVENLDCGLFHIGYILLLDALDEGDPVYGTKMARLLKMISDKGIKTSVDAVSEDGERFRQKIIPALPYCDYVIMNEIECCKVSGLSPRKEDGTIHRENIRETMTMFFRYGVREKVVIHCCEAGFIMDADGTFSVVPSFQLPDGYIKGSVGAGDAFAAACLYGLMKGYSDTEILEFASAASACSLSEADAVSGMRSRAAIEEIAKHFLQRCL